MLRIIYAASLYRMLLQFSRKERKDFRKGRKEIFSASFAFFLFALFA